MKLLSKFIKQILTETDNATFDSTRVWTAVGALTAIVLQCYTTFKTGNFDIVTFGAGWAVLTAGGAAGTYIKNANEPASEPEKPGA